MSKMYRENGGGESGFINGAKNMEFTQRRNQGLLWNFSSVIIMTPWKALQLPFSAQYVNGSQKT